MIEYYSMKHAKKRIKKLILKIVTQECDFTV